MLTETLSGVCPCCSYNKMLQRYGSDGYYHLDGCLRCGFGYGSNGENNVWGVDAWIDYAKYILTAVECETYKNLFEDDFCVIRSEFGYQNNGGKTKDEKAYEYCLSIINSFDEKLIRKMIFDWAEKSERCSDVKKTVFAYSEEEINNYKKSLALYRLSDF